MTEKDDGRKKKDEHERSGRIRMKTRMMTMRTMRTTRTMRRRRKEEEEEEEGNHRIRPPYACVLDDVQKDLLPKRIANLAIVDSQTQDAPRQRLVFRYIRPDVLVGGKKAGIAQGVLPRLDLDKIRVVPLCDVLDAGLRKASARHGQRRHRRIDAAYARKAFVESWTLVDAKQDGLSFYASRLHQRRHRIERRRLSFRGH